MSAQDQHTWEIKPSREEAEGIMKRLEALGWTVYPERVPLAGQSGYYCVHTVAHEDGSASERTHSIRWNLFDVPLHPLAIVCTSDAELLDFLWGHATHDGFAFFEYGDGDDGDVGFVCYCRGESGYSLVLHVSAETFPTITPPAVEVLRRFAKMS